MLLTVLGDTMASYRRSSFLPVAAMLSSRSSPVSVGRDVDELEGSPIMESGPRELDLASPAGAMPGASLGLSRVLEGEPLDVFSGPVDRTAIEDRRKFHPEADPALKTDRGFRTRLEASSLPQMAHSVQYVSSGSVITCIRRYTRRAVLLAKGKGGANKYRPPQNSEVCSWHSRSTRR